MRKLKLIALLFLGGTVVVSQVSGQKKQVNLEVTGVAMPDAEM